MNDLRLLDAVQASQGLGSSRSRVCPTMEAIGESIFCYIPRLADAFLDRGTGCGDVGGSPFATSLYAMHCEGGDAAAGVTFGAAKGALGRAVTAKRVFDRVERQECFFA
ncbi:hypothetical protein JL721_3937 [Aureococcus anophagefferens]|nr:hypothetical protein JL721_3937 [Aureococcus anophagefferens]